MERRADEQQCKYECVRVQHAHACKNEAAQRDPGGSVPSCVDQRRLPKIYVVVSALLMQQRGGSALGRLGEDEPAGPTQAAMCGAAEAQLTA